MTRRASAPKGRGGRGGHRNYPKPRVCQEHLVDKLTKYVKKLGTTEAFQLHEYESTSANQAIRVKALGKLGELILCLLAVDPSAQGLPYTEYKAAMHTVLSAYPEAKPHVGSLDGVAGDIADRFMVIINHVRKMAIGGQADANWDKVLAILPARSQWLQHLTTARDIIQASHTAHPCPSPPTSPARSAAPSPMEVPGDSYEAPPSPEEKASQDSDGYPTYAFMDSKGSSRPEDAGVEAMAAGYAKGRPPRKVPTKKPAGSDAPSITKKTAGSEEPSLSKKPAAAGKTYILEKATAKILDQKEKKVKKIKTDKATAKTLAETQLNIKIDKASMRLKGPYKGQSYIVHMKPPHLVVAVTRKQQERDKPTAGFHDICEQIFQKIKKTPSATKKMAIQWRSELLA
jgi:hypothetical protein